MGENARGEANERLGRRLRILRAERAIGIVEAAERCGISRTTLARLEAGSRRAYLPTLEKIARGYGVPIESLMEEGHPRHPEEDEERKKGEFTVPASVARDPSPEAFLRVLDMTEDFFTPSEEGTALDSWSRLDLEQMSNLLAGTAIEYAAAYPEHAHEVAVRVKRIRKQMEDRMLTAPQRALSEAGDNVAKMEGALSSQRRALRVS